MYQGEDNQSPVSYTHLMCIRDSLDTGYVCRQHESRFDWGIDRQMKVTNGYYRELMEANGSLAVSYTHLDVYKRQGFLRRDRERLTFNFPIHYQYLTKSLCSYDTE